MRARRTTRAIAHAIPFHQHKKGGLRGAESALDDCLAFNFGNNSKADRIVDVRNGVDTNAIQSNSAPTYLVRSIAVELQQPAGGEITKKIEEMPDG